MRLRCRLGVHRCPVRIYTRCECCGRRFYWDADHGKFNLERYPELRRKRSYG